MVLFSEQGPVRNLQITEETTSSFRVSWQAAPGPVIRYHLSYVPLSGAGETLEAQTVGAETTIVLQQLFPITTYRVSVAAEYPTGVGEAMQVDGTTKEGETEELQFIRKSFFKLQTCVYMWAFFSCSPWLTSWSQRFWRNRIHNEADMAGCSRKCAPVHHRLQTCWGWGKEGDNCQRRHYSGCVEEPPTGHWVWAVCQCSLFLWCRRSHSGHRNHFRRYGTQYHIVIVTCLDWKL